MDVRGQALDAATRCTHWSSQRDIVAFRFPCCQGWWPCRACHDEAVDHEPQVWSDNQHGEAAVLCGACRTPMTIHAYTGCGHACPTCGAGFNPGCQGHWDRYFDRP